MFILCKGSAHPHQTGTCAPHKYAVNLTLDSLFLCLFCLDGLCASQSCSKITGKLVKVCVVRSV